MRPGEPSRTLLRSAIRKAAHQLLDRPPLFEDPVVLRLVPEARDPAVMASLDDPGAPDAKLFRLLFAIRSRFSEDRLREAAARGVGQYVSIGAGLDTFPWRQPEYARGMRIFAADHPASLLWTKRRLQEHGLVAPDNLVQVAVDLETDRLDDRLAERGFEARRRSLFAALGVTQYLSARAVDVLLRVVATQPRGSELVLSFVPPDEELQGIHLAAALYSARRTASIGEPWISRFRPRELAARLHSLGFRDVFHLTPEAAAQRYAPGRQAALPDPPRWEQVMAAVR